MTQKTDGVLKTGTTTVGLLCKDGVVLAADRRATAGYVVDKHVVKIIPIAPNMAITTAGTVSEIQLLAKVIRAEIRLKNLHVGRDASVKDVANLISGLQYHTIRQFMPGIAAFILGGYDQHGPAVFDLSPDGAVTKSEDYVTDGSGCVFALGVLETLYKKDLNLKDCMELAKKAVSAAMQRDIYSGNGITIMTITNEGCKKALEQEINIGLY